MKSRRLLEVSQFAEMVGLRVPTIREKILNNKIAYVKIGRAVRIPIEEAERLMSEGWRSPVINGRRAKSHSLSSS